MLARQQQDLYAAADKSLVHSIRASRLIVVLIAASSMGGSQPTETAAGRARWTGDDSIEGLRGGVNVSRLLNSFYSQETSTFMMLMPSSSVETAIISSSRETSCLLDGGLIRQVQFRHTWLC
eukprot:scaffold309040_cov18-Prasinocladus_malaysianus.AAC.1